MTEGAPPAPSRCEARPERHLMVLLCALCTCINYADRVNMSVAIISVASELSLTTRQQSFVLSIFYLGYIPMNVGGALLCRRHGAKAVLLHGAVFWSVCTLLTPLAARAGLAVLLACRVAMGIAEGVAFPAIFHFIAQWVPPAERARAIGVFLTGVYVGTTVAFVVSPLLVAAVGWPSVFYCFGSASFLWIAAWHFLARDGEAVPATYQPLPVTADDASDTAADLDAESTTGNTAVVSADSDPDLASPSTPADLDSLEANAQQQSPRGSEIETAVRESGADIGTMGKLLQKAGFSRAETKLLRVIVTDRRMVAVNLAQCLFALVNYTILSWLPTYFKNVYGGSTQQLALTCMPYATMTVSSNVGGWLGDFAIARGARAQLTRRVLTGVSCGGAAVLLLVFVRQQSVGGGLAAMSGAMALQSLSVGGYESAFFDIARPDETGLFKAVANTLASVSAFVGVPLSVVVLDWLGGSWRKMFGSLAILYVVTGVVFCTMYTGERNATDEED